MWRYWVDRWRGRTSEVVGAAGLEPATLGLEIQCSIHLSYAPSLRDLEPFYPAPIPTARAHPLYLSTNGSAPSKSWRELRRPLMIVAVTITIVVPVVVAVPVAVGAPFMATGVVPGMYSAPAAVPGFS